MGTSFGIEMPEPIKRREGHEDYMTRKLRETKQALDLVNSPPHYNQGDIECIDAIHAALGTEGFLAYCRGNILKYNWRADHKGGIDDLEKSRWYLNKLIDTMRTKTEHQSPTKRGRK